MSRIRTAAYLFISKKKEKQTGAPALAGGAATRRARRTTSLIFGGVGGISPPLLKMVAEIANRKPTKGGNYDRI